MGRGRGPWKHWERGLCNLGLLDAGRAEAVVVKADIKTGRGRPASRSGGRCVAGKESAKVSCSSGFEGGPARRGAARKTGGGLLALLLDSNGAAVLIGKRTKQAGALATRVRGNGDGVGTTAEERGSREDLGLSREVRQR